jgi:hypothetical protein
MRRKILRGGLVLAMLPLLLSGFAPGQTQNVTFEASVDKNPVGLGDQFTLSLVLSNAGTNAGSNLRPPGLGDFRIITGPNRSTSMQIINGQMSSSITYSYVLQPKNTGTFTIGAATIEAGGQTRATRPLQLEVVKGQPPKQQPADPGDVTSLIGDNLFLKATVDKTRVTQGEQINLTFKLYTRVSVLNYAVEKVPTMRGFWSEEVETPKNISLSTEVVKGKQYRVGVIKRLALFPTQGGTLEISPMEVQTTVQVQPRRSTDPFESFFRDPFGRNVNHTVKSSPVKIRVTPLPGGAPDGFKGAVGQFAMSATVDRRTTRTNEPVTLKITISGSGNIKLLESPEIEVPPDFERYSPKVTDSINRAKGKISGSKTFEHLLIPRYPGLKVIKPLTFCYYDLGRREYVTLRSPQIELNVEQGSMAVPQVGGGARADVELLTQDIRFIKVSDPSLRRRDEFLHTGGLFVVLILLPLVGFAGAFVFARQRQAEMRDQAGFRNRRAIKVAQKGLKQAEYLLKEKSGSKGEPSSIQRVRFYAEVSRALWKYLGDKLGIPPSGLSLERASEELQDRSVDQGLIHALRILLESCDMARFAPTGLDLAAMQKTYEEARRIIIDLEKTLRSS